MQAIILAAGMGKRLKQLTANNTKCMVKVNGVTLIERMLGQLDRLGLERIVMVVGYEGEKLKAYVDSLPVKTPVCFVENPVYDKTNNIYSLALAKEYLVETDTLLLESDLIFEDALLDLLLEDPRDTLALVDKYESWMDGTVVKLSDEDAILDFVPGKKFRFQDIPSYYKTVNIYKFSRHFSRTHYVPFLEAYSQALGNNEYYEQVLRVITMLEEPGIRAKRLTGQAWYEIDDMQDLDIASSMFHEDPVRRVESLQKRGGGYWRYPKLLDFTDGANPFFPPERLKDEMKASFDRLLCRKPSSIKIDELLAAKNFGLPVEYVAVGNDVQELLEGATGTKSILDVTDWEFGQAAGEASWLTEETLRAHPEVLAVKDLAAVCGMPGLPLAVAACSDPAEMDAIRQKQRRFSLNSFAEFYLQIAEKYQKEYERSLLRFREEKETMERSLMTLAALEALDGKKGFRVIPGKPNYITCEVQSPLQCGKITQRLMTEFGILVRQGENCISMGIRTPEENQKLLQALKAILANP